MTQRLIACLLLLFTLTLPVSAESLHVSLQTEAELSLSLSQECEEAISRATRWLTTQPRRQRFSPPAGPNAMISMQTDAIMRYLEAIARDPEPVPVATLWLAQVDALTLQLCMQPSPFEARFATIASALQQHTFADMTINPMELALYLLYLNRLAPESRTALDLPDDWRTQCALNLITTQQTNNRGEGFWPHRDLPTVTTPLFAALTTQQKPHDETLWALLALKELIAKHPNFTLLPASALN